MDRIQRLHNLIENQFNNNQAEFARAIDRSPSQVHQLLSGLRNLGDGLARHIEMTLGLGEGWIDGLSSIKYDDGSLNQSHIQNNIPIISWDAIGADSLNHPTLESNTEQEWVATTRDHSPFSFALKIQGESMTDIGNPLSFFEGDIVLIDPKLTPKNGDFVIIKSDDNPQAFFKKLIIEGSKEYLKSLNPNWPDPIHEMRQNMFIYGVAFEKTVKLR